MKALGFVLVVIGGLLVYMGFTGRSLTELIPIEQRK